MAVIANRVRDVLDAVLGRGRREVISRTVRTYDVGMQTRYAQHEAAFLVQRFTKFAAVAIGMNAAGVASTRLSVKRRMSSTTKNTSFKRRRLGRAEFEFSKRFAGNTLACKALESADDVEEVTDPNHPYVSFLRSMWPGGSGFEFIEMQEIYQGLTGNAYGKLVWGTNEWPVECWPIPPQFIRPVPSKELLVSGYVYGRGVENENDKDPWAPREVVHWKRPNPLGDPYVGMGEVAKCLLDQDLSMAIAQHGLATMDNAAQPGLRINDPRLEADQALELEERIRNKAAGVSKAARTLVTNLGPEATVELWQQASRELSYLVSDEKSRNVICNVCNIPVALVTLDSAALASAYLAVELWQRLGLRPRCFRYEDRLNEMVTPLFRQALGDDSLFVQFDNPVDEDRKRLREEMALFAEKGFISTSAAANRLGIPQSDQAGAVDPNADPVLQLGPDDVVEDAPAPIAGAAPAGGVVQDTALNGAQVTALAELAAAVADGQLPLESAQAIAAAAFPLVKPEQITAIFSPLKNFEPKEEPPPVMPGAVPPVPGKKPEEDKEPPKPKPVPKVKTFSSLWFDPAPACCAGHSVTKDKKVKHPDGEVIEMTERQLEVALKRLFTSLLPDPADIVAQGPAAIDLSTNPDAIRSFNAAVMPKLDRISVVGYNRGVAETPEAELSKIVKLSDPAAARLRQYGLRLVKSIDNTLKDQVREVLASGVEEGLTQPQLTEAVREVLGPGTEIAAERISRTEVSRAYNESREDAWKDSDIVEGKEWQLSGDPCPLCRAMAEKVNQVPIGGAFITKGATITLGDGTQYTNDWGDVLCPPIHPNDRCTIVAVFKKEPAGV